MSTGTWKNEAMTEQTRHAEAGTVAEILREARRVLDVEAGAVQALAERLDEDFARAVQLLLDLPGRVVVSGLGKSGIIARKLASTLTSTGTAATFLHPIEGLHGDLGIVRPTDVAILISKSGDTCELGGLVEYLLRAGVPIIAMTGQTDSPLAAQATVVLDCSVDEEACPMDLAPTSSTTATMALGDALAVVLLQRKGFREEDFARLHPGGALGRKLTMRVADVMVAEDYPSLQGGAVMRDCIVPLAEMRGTVPIVDSDCRVIGVVTAGDLTRLMERTEEFLDVGVSTAMTEAPQVVLADQLASGAVRTMEEHGIMALPVVGHDGRLEGIVHLHDLLRSGVV